MTFKKILITGGAGFIGSHLAEALVKDGYSVKILDDFSSGNVNNILRLFNDKNFKLVRGSVTNKLANSHFSPTPCLLISDLYSELLLHLSAER